MAEKAQTKAAAAMADDKKRAIETAMQQIERTYGKGSIMRFGDNMRVLQWIISRADNEIGAAETALGYEPNTHDIDMEGLDMSMYDMRRLLSVDRDLWLKECEDARAYYEKIGKVPPELYSELDALEMRLNRGYKVEH